MTLNSIDAYKEGHCVTGIRLSPRKRCTENMQQIYSKATLLKSHFDMGVLL